MLCHSNAHLVLTVIDKSTYQLVGNRIKKQDCREKVLTLRLEKVLFHAEKGLVSVTGMVDT